MSSVPPIPVELWDQIPPVAQAAILALVQQYQQQLQALQQQVAQLTERLNQNSTNSSRSPPHVERRPPKSSSGRKRGGQPGPARQQQPLVPPDQVKQAIPVKPSACRKCGQALRGEDPQP